MAFGCFPCKDPKSDCPGVFHLPLVQLHRVGHSQSMGGLLGMRRCSCDETRAFVRQGEPGRSIFILTWGAGKFSTTLAIHSHCQRQVRQVMTREESQPDVLTSDLLLTRTSANTHQNGSLPTFPPLQSGATKTSLIGLGKGTISRHKTRDAMTDTWETPIEC